MKGLKKAISLLLCLAVLLSICLLSMASTTAAETVPSGYTAVSTAQGLAAIANNMSGKYFLTADITLTSDWTPLGHEDSTSWTNFTGILDGNGHKISGLKSTGDYSGLIRSNYGTIQNLTIASGTITASVRGASICVENHGEILNCKNYATVAGTGTPTAIGGICAVNNGTITACINYGTISSPTNVGGIAAYNSDTIELCGNHGKITSEVGNSSGNAGGIAGRQTTAYGSISCAWNTGSISGNTAGGIVGHVNTASSGAITDDYNIGAISGGYTGGIVGWGYGSFALTRCYNAGTVRGNGAAGALAGYGDGSSYNSVKFNNCFYLNTMSKPLGYGTISGTPLAKTEAEMKTQSTFTNFDFSSVWQMGACIGYPTLRGSDAVLHSYKAVVTPPTCLEVGFTTHTCSLCGDSYTDTEVPVGGHTYQYGVCTVCGIDCLEWSFSEKTGILTIFGEGKMGDYSPANDKPAPWFEHAERITSVVIRPGVMSIGNNAFKGLSAMKEISIPDGIESIGAHAFNDCTSLTDVIVPKSVEFIDKGAFASRSIENLVILNPDCEVSFTDWSGAYTPDATEGIGLCDNTLGYTGTAIIHAPATEEYSNLQWIAEDHGCYYNIDNYPVHSNTYHACTYVDNGDGTHDLFCNACNSAAIDDAPHSFIGGVCECGSTDGWSFDKRTGTLTIYNTDPMTNYGAVFQCETCCALSGNPNYCVENGCLVNRKILIEAPETPWAAHNNEINRVVITAEVDWIGENAFVACPNMDEIVVLNPDCEFPTMALTVDFGPGKEDWDRSLTVYGYAGSSAETYVADLFADDFIPLNACECSSPSIFSEREEPDCTTEGFYNFYCANCVCAIYEEIIPANGHSYEAVVTDPTCAEDGFTTHTCTVCGDSYTDTPTDALGHDYHASSKTEGTVSFTQYDCSRCDDYYREDYSNTALKFKQASVTLSSDFSINFYIRDTVLAGFSDPYVVFKKAMYDASGNIVDYETVEVTEYTRGTSTDGVACHIFQFAGINSAEMGSNVSATLYASKDGIDYTGKTVEYSVVKYATNMLGKTTDAKLRTLLVDLLNYGAQAQTYFGYNTANPANKDLNEEQKAYATSVSPSLSSCRRTASNPGATISFKTATLVLENKVTVNYYLNLKNYTGSVDDLYAVVTYKDHLGKEWDCRIDSEDFDYKPYSGSNYYVVNFDELNAMQMRTPCTLTLYSKTTDECVSSTLYYSIESYAYSMQSSSNKALVSLIDMMMKYGDATAAYFTN